MITYIFGIILEHCCFGKTKKEQKLIHKIQDDIVELTKEELEQLTNFITKPKKSFGCC